MRCHVVITDKKKHLNVLQTSLSRNQFFTTLIWSPAGAIQIVSSYRDDTKTRRQPIREIDFFIHLISHISLKGFLINLYLITDKVKPIPFVTEHHYILSKDFPSKISKIMAAQASECFLGRVSPETYY